MSISRRLTLRRVISTTRQVPQSCSSKSYWRDMTVHCRDRQIHQRDVYANGRHFNWYLSHRHFCLNIWYLLYRYHDPRGDVSRSSTKCGAIPSSGCWLFFRTTTTEWYTTTSTDIITTVSENEPRTKEKCSHITVLSIQCDHHQLLRVSILFFATTNRG